MTTTAAASVASSFNEIVPPMLDANSDPPSLFDGTTRLYVALVCPFAQRSRITRNYKGLQERIELVSVDLLSRPAWYKEKLYPANKVPALEHNNKVIGESLDVIKYINEHFEGPALLPEDPAKRELAEELFSYSDMFNGINFKAFASSEDVEEAVGPAYNKIEEALSKFDDGPFFLGQFSLVDITYAPFVERFKAYFAQEKNYNVTEGKPKLGKWLEELNKIDAYVVTKYDPQVFISQTKKRLGIA